MLNKENYNNYYQSAKIFNEFFFKQIKKSKLVCFINKITFIKLEHFEFFFFFQNNEVL